jgi:predicted permease
MRSADYGPGVRLVEAFLQDLRQALRRLARERGFAATAIVVLGLGLGVNNMMFTLIYGTTLRGLPIPDRDRVLHVSAVDQRFPDRPLTFAEFDHLRRHARAFEGLAAFATAPVAVSDPDRAPDRFDATYLTANALPLVRTAPRIGRGFVEADDRPGAEPVALLGAAAWRTRYGRDPAIVGHPILIDGVPTKVIGIMPDPSRFPTTAEVWLPLARMQERDPHSVDERTLRVFGRVQPSAPESDARAEIETLFAAVPGRSAETDLRARVVPINERYFFPATQPGWLAFSAAALLILIVTCANAANLMLSAMSRRTREIALRTSLGASRARIASQIFIDSLALAVMSGLVATGVSLAAVRLFRSAIPAGAMPYWLDYSMDARVLLALAAAVFVAALLVGLAPAIHAARTDVNRVLKDGGRAATGRSNRRLAAAFLAAELAIAIVLAMQFGQSWIGTPRLPSDPIVETADVLTATVTLPSATYPVADARAAFVDRLADRAQGASRVTAIAAASSAPLGGAVDQRVDIDDAAVEAERAPLVATLAISADYFDALALPIVSGRAFGASDGLPGQETALVNRRFAAVYFEGADPIGHRLRLTPATATAPSSSWLTIVGVTDDIRQRTTGGAAPIVYTPLRAAPPATIVILVRSRSTPDEAADWLRREVMAIDPGLPLFRVATLVRAIEDAQWNGRVSHRLITALTLLAVVVSIVGLYAVTAHAVSQRTREFGIRMAFGARAADVGRLVLGRAAVPVGLGLLGGLAGSALWTSAFFSGAESPPLVRLDVFVPVAIGLVGVTLAACALPVRRAVRVDPARTLRVE